MLYLGSKRRIAKHIVPIINTYRNKNQIYIEPFVGGANMFEMMDNPRIGYDINEYLICFLREIRDNPTGFPKDETEFSEERYNFLKDNYRLLHIKDYPIIGFAGFPLSFGGKWFGGYCRRKKPPFYDYVKGAFNSIQRQSKKIQGAAFNVCSYNNLHSLKLIKPAIVYCDPPYRNTTKYSNKFDHDGFFQWCRKQANFGHKIFISEYNAPDDFQCIWEHEYFVNISSTRKKADKRIERLFTIN